jgi:tRNA A37 methylthiotransferase MiaB
MEKKAKVARAAEGVVNCYKVGMRLWPNMMIGYPGETRETIMETVAFCKALKIPYEPAFVTLFPNSKMFHDFKNKVTFRCRSRTRVRSLEVPGERSNADSIPAALTSTIKDLVANSSASTDQFTARVATMSPRESISSSFGHTVSRNRKFAGILSGHRRRVAADGA